MEVIRVVFLSCGGRANELMGSFSKVPGVKIVGLCDPDSSRVAKAKTRFPGAKTANDLRRLIGDPNIDALVVATCNHWECLASIWAMQAELKKFLHEKKSPNMPGPGSGYIVYCQAGRLEGQRGSARAYDKDGKRIKEFKGNGGGGHQVNFVEAVTKSLRTIDSSA